MDAFCAASEKSVGTSIVFMIEFLNSTIVLTDMF